MPSHSYTPGERGCTGPVNLIDLEADAQARSESPCGPASNTDTGWRGEGLPAHGTPRNREATAVRANASHGGNPKDAIGASKAPLSTLEPQVVHEMALAMFEGECKYWRHNYIASRVRAMVYADAHDRHMSDWKSGQDIDPDSGLPHLMKAAACLHIIRAAEIHGSLIDDRPPANPDPEWMKKLDAKALDIVQRLSGFERGAFTEANRAEWPAMCERLANGPIPKLAAPPAPGAPFFDADKVAAAQWVALHVPPARGTAVEVRLYGDSPSPEWCATVFERVDEVGDWAFDNGAWYRPSDPGMFTVSAVRVRA
jgi:hypothetical protein